jgi:hypothetical protein
VRHAETDGRMSSFGEVRTMARTLNWSGWGEERLILRVSSSDMRLYATFLGVGWGGPFPYLQIQRAFRAKNKVTKSMEILSSYGTIPRLVPTVWGLRIRDKENSRPSGSFCPWLSVFSIFSSIVPGWPERANHLFARREHIRGTAPMSADSHT